MDINKEYEHAMSLVAEAEKGSLSKFSAETRASADLICVVDTFHRQRQKCIDAELKECKLKLIKYEQDYKAKATGFRIEAPKPGTDKARLMHAAKAARMRSQALEDENLRLIVEIDDLNAELSRCKDRLQIDPGGSDKIDEQQQSIDFLRHNLETAECERDKAQERMSTLETENLKLLAEIDEPPNSTDDSSNPDTVFEWLHVNSVDDPPRVEAHPEHFLMPHLIIQRCSSCYPVANVRMLYRELESGEGHIASFSVWYRDDLPVCSQCGGTGRCLGADGEYDCQWCTGQGA